MNFIYVKCTIPELPEALQVSVSKVIQALKTPEATLAKIQREAAKRGVRATYELVTAEDYKAHRTAINGLMK